MNTRPSGAPITRVRLSKDEAHRLGPSTRLIFRGHSHMTIAPDPSGYTAPSPLGIGLRYEHAGKEDDFFCFVHPEQEHCIEIAGYLLVIVDYQYERWTEFDIYPSSPSIEARATQHSQKN